MNFMQCRDEFPTFKEFQNISKLRYRLLAIESNITHDHALVMAKLSEMTGSDWPVPVLQWMYLMQDPEKRIETIGGYIGIIRELEIGELIPENELK